MIAEPARLRCAIYTRKSSDEGLDQQFNSLDAQHDAGAAYIKSQSGVGWRPLLDRYDDGGFSGGSMERPALRRLLADIADGKIDVVVVYKIDRLTRALCDFARMVELFDQHHVCFVSVTQAFNTTTSMGRLTLNVLLSFAQFEREVTGERIRDKIAASKARGMWMGGLPPLGYDVPEAGSRTLRRNPDEAEIVRTIFETYSELGSVHILQRCLKEQGTVSKIFTTRAGRTLGGAPFSRGALFHLLRNRVYLGLIVHKGRAHPGEHLPIIPTEMFDAVQALLNKHARRSVAARSAPTAVLPAPLTGRLFDTDGHPMCPTFTRGARGQVYRYYVSATLQQGQRRKQDSHAIRRVSASALEAKLTAILDRLLPDSTADRLSAPFRVEVHSRTLEILLPARVHVGIGLRLLIGETVHLEPGATPCTRVTIPIRMQLRGGRTIIQDGPDERHRRDARLIEALRAAHTLLEVDAHRLPVLDNAPASSYACKLLRLALLAPDLQEAILSGRQMPGLSITQILRRPVALAWKAQRTAFG